MYHFNNSLINALQSLFPDVGLVKKKFFVVAASKSFFLMVFPFKLTVFPIRKDLASKLSKNRFR